MSDAHPASGGPVPGPGPGPATAPWLDRYEGSLMNLFGRPQLVLDHGEGAWVWDVDGRRYLDLVGGIAVNALGHNHPALVAAVSKQAGQLVHVSNFFTSIPQVELAERLLHLAQAPAGSAVFFCNSGTEALEAVRAAHPRCHPRAVGRQRGPALRAHRADLGPGPGTDPGRGRRAAR